MAFLPKVTIVTPVYNGSRYIEFLIDSVLEQSYPHIEHIIINDGSDDDGATTSILKKFPHLLWWERENRGQYATMNEGLVAATGDWICFVSADDILFPEAVATVVGLGLKKPDIDGIYGRAFYMKEEGDAYPVQPILTKKTTLYKYVAQIPHCSLYMRRKYLIENSLRFDEKLKFNGDYDWFLSVLQKKPMLCYVPKYLSSIRQHDAQISRCKVDEILEERKLVINKYKINPFIYRGLNFCLTLRHATHRIIYQFRNNGFGAGLKLIWYFILHKLGLN